MSSSFTCKQEEIRAYFKTCSGPQQIYEKIILLGKRQEELPLQLQTEANRVSGCQSTLYLTTEQRDGHLYFQAQSDALISAGLAQLLIWAYSGEEAETILTSEPTFLKELAIPTSLSPSRANGLASLLLRMKQEALRSLTTHGC